VVHRKHGILVTRRRRKCSIRRHWPAYALSSGNKLGYDRCNHGVVLGSQVATFTGMRIESADDDFGFGDAEKPAQVIQ
jgi:hypothetical protein